jgi:hypothetical protein
MLHGEGEGNEPHRPKADIMSIYQFIYMYIYTYNLEMWALLRIFLRELGLERGPLSLVIG